MKVVEGTNNNKKIKSLVECIKSNWDVYNNPSDWEDVAHYTLALLEELACIGNPYHIIGLMQCGTIHIYRDIESMAEDDDDE